MSSSQSAESTGMAAIRPDYPEPLWVQAVVLIMGEIDRGALKPGSRLPPERELCKELGISRVTLRKALTHLVEEGVLSPSHGRGWYVAAAADGGGRAEFGPVPAKEWPNSLESFTETAVRMGLKPTSIVLRAEKVPASIDEGERLQVAPGTPLMVLERVRLLDGVPIAVDMSRIPHAIVPGFAEMNFEVDSMYSHLEAHGIRLARADSTIEARAADESLSAHLDLEIGKPILVLTQLVIDPEDRPVMASQIQYSGDRYRLRTQFARAGGR